MIKYLIILFLLFTGCASFESLATKSDMKSFKKEIYNRMDMVENQTILNMKDIDQNSKDIDTMVDYIYQKDMIEK